MTRYSVPELIDLAKQVEEAGELFYDAAATAVSDARVRELFTQLRADERRHAAEFEAMLGGLTEELGQWREDDHYVAYLRAVVDGRVFKRPEEAQAAVAELADVGAAVRFAIDLEKNTILFLHELKTMLRPEAHELVEELVAEEQEHVRKLSALLATV